MDKILSKNTIKNVFSALGAKTSDSNYAVGLFDKTTAEPKGIMGMSDLASVLGVFKYVGDINTATGRSTLVSGYYRISTTPPSWWFNNSDANGLVVVFEPSSNFKTIIYIAFESGDIYHCGYSWTEWRPWKKLTATTL